MNEALYKDNILDTWIAAGMPAIGRWVSRKDNRSVLGKLQRAIRKEYSMSIGDYRKIVQERDGFVDVQTEVFTGAPRVAYVIQEYTGALTVEGDAIVSGDVHLPTTDFAMCELLLDVAKHENIKQLCIVGDLINCDLQSIYSSVVPPIPFEAELALSTQLLNRYAEWFDLILLTIGNHEKRLYRVNGGDISNTTLGRMLAGTNGKLQISPYPNMTLLSGGVRWVCTHPRNYRQMKTSLGDQLAQKHQANVVVLHQHHVSKSLDKWGRYVVIDGGGLFDTKLMAYVSMEDSVSPAMCQGFTVIKNGVGELVTPYPAFTDIHRWISAA